MAIFPIFIPHAGCPHTCIYCAQERSTGYSGLPDASWVAEYLDIHLPVSGKGEIAFYGGTFTMLSVSQQELYLDVARKYIASGRASEIRISTRPDALGKETLVRLRTAGVRTIEIGCQSFINSVLEQAGRGHDAGDNSLAVKNSQQAGFKVGIQLMPGLPGGDVKEAMFSLTRAMELSPSFLRIYPAIVIKGTALAAFWESGDYLPWSLEKAVDICADMLLMCTQKGVTVARLGLQYDQALEDNYLAGPFHPAFGQLVRSRIWRRALSRAGSEQQTILVHPDDYSDVVGHKAENRTWLKNRFPGLSVLSHKSVPRGVMRSHNMNRPVTDVICPGGHCE